MPEEIQKKLIEEEMKEAYLDYAMSVIVSRALPSVYDGLKPVHRRILFGMHQLSLQHNKPFKKSARIVGEVMGKFHPHGDAAIYDALVRMAQDFSLRYPLVQGQGNFGSSEDAAASQRYTEARLSKIAEEMLKDIDKDTVDFVPNFDGSLEEPFVLPAKIPNLLINGSSGIAVGMATNIPPHNISEVISAVMALIEKSDLEIKDLIKYIKGPDFPTAGIILGKQGIKDAYKTGRGKIILRAKTEVENNNIIITEIPYQVNKSLLLEDIASLVRDKRVQGISDIRDESDKNGIRVVIKLKQNYNPDVVLNQLYKHTSLQVTFGIINLALVDNEPKLLNLKQILECYISHRKEVITRRTQFDLEKSEARAHILEGLKIALENIDAIVKLIKASKDVKQAESDLISNFKLSVEQAKAILDMKLQRLTSLETEKINIEHKELLKLIKELKEILASEVKVYDLIKKDLVELKEKYSDDRRTLIQETSEVIETEDLIKEEDVVITVTHKGYIKQLPLETYKKQKRGGQGVKATGTSEDDFVENLFITSNHNYLLVFTDKGKVHWIKAYEIPQASRYSKGKAIVNLLKLKDAKVNTIIPVKEFSGYLVLATKDGLIKKTSLEEFSKPRKGGILAISLKENDELISVKLTSGDNKLIVATRNGLAIRFSEDDVREMGRKASGVRAIKLKKEDKVISMERAPDNSSILTITENGNGKRTKTDEYRMIKRGGVGVINIITNALKKESKNSFVAGVKSVNEDDEILFITSSGIIIRTSVKNISLIGRNTQGVRLMKLKENDKVTAIAKVVKE